VGTVGSRSLAVGGTALRLAGAKVKAKMARFAAHLMEAREEEILFQDEAILVDGVPDSSIAFADVAAYAYVPTTLPPDTEPGLSDEAFWEPESMTFPFGCYIVQIEIDRDTGETALQRLFGVDDCGVVVNPLIVDGQIHGGLAQGIGPALLEEIVHDSDGQLVTGTFMDYAIPRASHLPRFVLDYTQTPTHVNPLGAKGVGEAGTIGSTPAVANAVVDALGEFGATHVDLAFRPEKLWRIIHQQP
jgi:carbon-monoxide dehydrogenase large subunit